MSTTPVIVAASTLPMVEMRGVSKQFGQAPPVLQPLDLQIEKGEFVTLLGPSGCGKSTLLKLIAGLLLPSAGEIRVDGVTSKNARQLLSYIFQDPTLLPWRTVTRNVALGLELEHAARDRQQKKAAELLELVGLTHVANAYPRELSGGMRMRVSIARALASNPRLLLMDEPFAALDELSREHFNEEILRLREEQKWTAIFVTHSVSEAVFLSTRIVILAPNPGRIASTVPVDFGLPRTAALRTAPEFERLVAAVSEVLRGAAAP